MRLHRLNDLVFDSLTPMSDGSPVVSARSDPQQQRAILVIGNLPFFGVVATVICQQRIGEVGSSGAESLRRRPIPTFGAVSFLLCTPGDISTLRRHRTRCPFTTEAV